jgi:hypothetical protein
MINQVVNQISSIAAPPPVGLDSKNFLVEETFHELLKLMKLMKHIRIIFQEINPGIFAKVINKRDIIFEFAN